MKAVKRDSRGDSGGDFERRRAKSNKAKPIPAEVIAKRYYELLELRAELQRVQRRRNPG
jgi:hypothetical protein